MNDSFGNSLFGGVSGEEKPFSIDSKGTVSYVGSALAREVKVSPSLHVRQNFAGIHYLRIFLQEMEKFQYLRS